MRKFTATLLALLLMLTALPAFAANNRDLAMNFLMEKYDVPAEQIELFEGGTMTLAQIGENFWSAKYTIYKDGTAIPDRTEPITTPEDIPTSDRGLLIAPDQNDGNTYGGIYIREKTGEILSLEEMDSYFLADSTKAEAEWERLRKEAGKLDVSLYSKLKTMAAGDKVKVIIYPAFIETAALQAQYEALKARYPEFAKDLPKLSEIFSGGYYAITLPAPMILREGIPMDLPLGPTEAGQGSTEAGQGSTEAGQGPTEAVQGSTEAGQGSSSSIEPAGASSDPSAGRPNDENWQLYTAFQEELDAIRRAGLAPSLSAIGTKLGTMNISYELNDNFVTTELNTAQINEIATLSDVDAVYEDAIFTTMDLAENARQVAAPATNQDEAQAESQAKQSASLLWLLLLIPATAAAYIIRKRTTKTQ